MLHAQKAHRQSTQFLEGWGGLGVSAFMPASKNGTE